MTSDLDIYRSAQVLVKQHGADASIQAAMRADSMLDKGDLDGYAALKHVAQTVQEMALRVNQSRGVARPPMRPPGYPNRA